jgi:hypothetical protein
LHSSPLTSVHLNLADLPLDSMLQPLQPDISVDQHTRSLATSSTLPLTPFHLISSRDGHTFALSFVSRTCCVTSRITCGSGNNVLANIGSVKSYLFSAFCCSRGFSGSTGLFARPPYGCCHSTRQERVTTAARMVRSRGKYL